MREYFRVAPQFWTGNTGRDIRALGGDAQRVALYLITGPTAHPLGIYYLPIPTLCHEVGIACPEAQRALENLAAVGFIEYDAGAETVWVPHMAEYQIGPELKPGDKRLPWIRAELQKIRHPKFKSLFLNTYGHGFHLSTEAPSKGHRRGIEGASKPLRSIEQEQEQELEQEHEQDKKRAGPAEPVLNGSPSVSVNGKSEEQLKLEKAIYRNRLYKAHDDAVLGKLHWEHVVQEVLKEAASDLLLKRGFKELRGVQFERLCEIASRLFQESQRQLKRCSPNQRRAQLIPRVVEVVALTALSEKQSAAPQ